MRARHSTLRHCYICGANIRVHQNLKEWLSINGIYVYLCHSCNSRAMGKRRNGET